MPLMVFLNGAATFLASLILHIFVWRFHRPRRQIVWLATVFWAAPVLFWTVHWLAQGLPYFRWEEAAATALLHFALTCAYIQSYPAIFDLSPSLLIMPLVARVNGASFEEILKHLDRPMLLEERIQYLMQASLIRQNHGKSLELTTRSRLLVNLFVLIRHALGMPLGKG